MGKVTEVPSDIIKLWRDNNVESAVFTFSCGGDSMGDSSWEVFPEDVPDDAKKEIEDYLNDEVYDRVEFYVNSDGHYEGETGTVTVNLEEGESDFSYSKTAESEYNEHVVNVVDFKLTSEEEAFIVTNVMNINGGDGSITFNYKRDFIMSDEEEELQEALEGKIKTFVEDYQPDNMEEGGELREWTTFTTNEDGEDLKVEDNHLKISIDNSYTIYKPSDD